MSKRLTQRDEVTPTRKAPECTPHVQAEEREQVTSRRDASANRITMMKDRRVGGLLKSMQSAP